ncbi:MAG: hypothetical protein ACI4AK_07120 [Lepagella sp.]
MSTNNLIWPAPPGQIALVCCSTDNLCTIKDPVEPKSYRNYKVISDQADSIRSGESVLNKFKGSIFQSAVDCGFNVLMYPGSDLQEKCESFTQSALNFCLNKGIKLIINSPILKFNPTPGCKQYKQEWPMSFVEKFVNHPALGGWQVKDEPTFSDWHDPNSVDYICNNYQNILNFDNKHIVFMNLAASTNSLWIGSHNTYESYLDEYERTFNPPLWTFDLYPVKRSIDKTTFTVDTITHIHYLNIFSKKAQESGKPFWAYCLCLAHKTDKVCYPFPSEGILRFEAFSALAFGAQGLVFWNYKKDYSIINVRNENNELIGLNLVENDEMGPLDLYGNKTPIWDHVKTILGEVKAENSFFYNCRTTEYIHVDGNSTAPTNGYGALNEVRAYGHGLLITKIEKPNPDSSSASVPTYIMIVNCDPFNEQKIGLHFVIETNNTPNTGNTSSVDTGLYPLNPNDDGNYNGSNYWQEETLKPGGFYRYRIY